MFGRLLLLFLLDNPSQLQIQQLFVRERGDRIRTRERIAPVVEPGDKRRISLQIGQFPVVSLARSSSVSVAELTNSLWRTPSIRVMTI